MNNYAKCIPIFLMRLCISLMCAIIFLSCSSESKKEKIKPVVKITTGLGVETDITLKGVEVDNKLLHSALWIRYDKPEVLPVEVTNGVYISYPLNNIIMFKKQHDKHIIKMVNDQEIIGKLFGRITSDDNKFYDLKDIDLLKVVSVENLVEPSDERNQIGAWKLTVSGDENIAYQVFDVKFNFRYYSQQGFMIGGQTSGTSENFFFILVDDQEQLANIRDFISITVEKPENKPGTKITVKSNSGVETSGILILKTKDSKGWHKAERDWALRAKMVSNENIYIAIKGRQWTLSRGSQ